MEEKKSEKTKEIKTASYTRRAVDRYQEKKKIITVTLDINDYKKLSALGVVSAADVRRVLLEYIEKNDI